MELVVEASFVGSTRVERREERRRMLEEAIEVVTGCVFEFWMREWKESA